jgi:pilus assembly protein CpaE
VGAQEFLGRPLDIRELGEAIKRIGGQLHRRVSSEDRGGKIVAVCASKGGLGVTAIATNLAVSLARQEKKKTALVDLNLHSGDVPVLLDMRPDHTMADIVGNGPLEEARLRTMLTAYDSNLFVLPGAERPGEADRILPVHLAEVFSLLPQMCDYVIIDAGQSFDSRTLEAFNLADLILLVTVLSVPAVRSVSRGLGLFHDFGCSKEKVRLIINRYQKKSRVTEEDLKSASGVEVLWRIPNDYRTMGTAIDSGVPVVVQSPRSELSKSFDALARELSGVVATTAAAGEA